MEEAAWLTPALLLFSAEEGGRTASQRTTHT